MTATLLVELLTEELPPKSLNALSKAFGNALVSDLGEDGFLTEASVGKVFASPRRLAVLISNVRDKSLDKAIEFTGPPINAPQQAVLGFAKKNGVSVEELTEVTTPKGKVYAYRTVAAGSDLATNLSLKVEYALKRLPVAKTMRWGSGDAQFVRPVHGLMMMHGAHIVPGEVLGLESGRKTAGHRFMGKSEIVFAHADEYEARLQDEGMVIADFAKRRAEIDTQLRAQARRENATLGEHQPLLDEVTALVEFPCVYLGAFEQEFLEVPTECLVLTMRQNQKYFPLFGASGTLLPKFLIVSNMRVSDPRHIVGGNERVIRPRFEDARFFYNQDRKVSLASRLDALKSVVYYRKLGSQYDRVMRIRSLAGRIAKELKADTAIVTRAAELSKTDLVTGMVGEFPELQGIMGRYYALHDNEPNEVAQAIEQHYRPRFSGDALPQDLTSSVLALADKLEAITGMFGVGQEPTGDKDPFALRRSALGIIRILVEKRLEARLQPLVDMAIGEMPATAQSDWARVVGFLLDRARSYFLEKGFAGPAIEAVLQPFGANSPLYVLLGSVAEASRIISTTEGRILAEANKRITNILKKSGFPVPFGLRPEQLIKKPDPTLFREQEETAFWQALQTIGERSLELRRQQKYAESLGVLCELAAPTKSFFDNVLVNAKEPDIQSNRIILIQHARAYMNQVADLSLMAS